MTRKSRTTVERAGDGPIRAAPQKRYNAVVLGDGSIMPIAEMVGRHLIREINPLSVEGRDLLTEGHVTLWYDDGARVETAPIHDILDRMQSSTRVRRDAYPELPRWTAHHDRMLKSIGRMKKTLKPRA